LGPKTSKRAFLYSHFPKKQNMGEKKLPLQKIIVSTSSIYDKIFILLSFEIKELAKLKYPT
jgi:hypothetical protein